jgi:hypothetical protein
MLSMADVEHIARTRTRAASVTLRTDLEHFVAAHSAHGGLAGDIGHLSESVYRHTIACPCGATFHRCIVPRSDGAQGGVTSRDADLARAWTSGR